MTTQLILPRATDANDNPLAGARAYVYQTGTTTAVTVYSDTALSVPHPQPIVADAEGRFPQAFYGGSVNLKVKFTDSSDVEFETLDPAHMTLVTGSTAAGISFTPTASINETNVQDAIEKVQANLDAASSNPHTVVSSGGTGAAYTITAPSTIAGYEAGQMFVFRAHTACAANPTLAVDGLAAVGLKTYVAGAKAGLVAGEISKDAIVGVIHDGTDFVVVFGIEWAAAATWRDVKASRVAGTSYQNTTDRPMEVSIAANSATSVARDVEVSADGATWSRVGYTDTSSGGYTSCQFIVPPGWYYRISDTATVKVWMELSR